MPSRKCAPTGSPPIFACVPVCEVGRADALCSFVTFRVGLGYVPYSGFAIAPPLFRVAVVGRIVIIIFFFVVVFLFVLFLVWLLAKEEIGICRVIRSG